MICVHLRFTKDTRRKAQIRGMLEAEGDLLTRLLKQYELLDSRYPIDRRGYFRYVQIHMVVAETRDWSVISSTKGEGN